MKNFILSLLLTSYFLLLTSFLPGCARHELDVKLDAEDQFKVAKQEFEQKHYDKAINGFKRIMFEFPGSKWVEEAQYWLAKSYFEQKNYPQAELEYDFFLRSFSRSRFADDAYFELCLCYFKQSPPYWLDQSLTERALQRFRAFEIRFPDSNLLDKAKEYEKKCISKLVKKDLETAKLYIKMGRPKSAVLYLKDIQEQYPENSDSQEIAELLEKCNARLQPR